MEGEKVLDRVRIEMVDPALRAQYTRLAVIFHPHMLVVLSPKIMLILYPSQTSTELVFRGRELSLNYTNGSPCDSPTTHERRKLKHSDDDDDDDDDDKKKGDDDEDDNKKSHKGKASDDGDVRRKSTLISLACDQNLPLGKAHISFIGSSPDQCTYFFRAKTMAACGGVKEPPTGLGAGGVFFVMYASPFPTISVPYLHTDSKS